MSDSDGLRTVIREEIQAVFGDPLGPFFPEDLRSLVVSWVQGGGGQVGRSSVVGLYTTAATVSEFGEFALGRPVTLRAGSDPFHFIQMTADPVYGKWVSSQLWYERQISAAVVTDANTSYVHAARSAITRFTIPGFKAFYDAGLRPQVYVVASMAPSGSGFTTFARVGILQTSVGDTGDMPTAGSEIATGGEITRTGSTVRAFVESGWGDVTFSSAPTKTTGHCVLQFKQSAGTGAYMDLSYALRWVADPA